MSTQRSPSHTDDDCFYCVRTIPFSGAIISSDNHEAIANAVRPTGAPNSSRCLSERRDTGNVGCCGIESRARYTYLHWICRPRDALNKHTMYRHVAPRTRHSIGGNHRTRCERVNIANYCRISWRLCEETRDALRRESLERVNGRT